MRKLREHERPRRPDQKQLGSDERSLAVNARASDTDSAEAITAVDDGEIGSKDLEGGVFGSATALVKSKGYGLKINLLRDIEIVAYKPVEVTARRYIIDILLLKFQSGERLAKVGEAAETFQPLKVENHGIGPLCRELTEETQNVASAILEKSPELLESHVSLSGSSLIAGLETYSANLLLSKVTYHRFNGKSVRFWISPILLTSSKLKNDLGEEKAWIPALGDSGKNDVDIVHVGNLPSYLDFREKEVRALGRDLFDSDAEPVRFPGAIRLFRFLTILASLILLGGYLAYALSLRTGTSVAGLSALLATMVESVGGLRLFRSYRQLNREDDATSSGSPRITPEQVVAHEAEFTPDELSYLYSKYGGAELSELRKEFRHQRIIELTKKAKDIFSKVRKLEREGFNSEVVLSLDRAARSLLTAILLSIGVDTQGRGITEWFPLLRKNIPGTKLEDIKSLWMLRDRINRGHDATKNEAKRAKQIAEPIVDDALRYLNRFLKKQGLSSACQLCSIRRVETTRILQS
jgi:hypothetical protein